MMPRTFPFVLFRLVNPRDLVILLLLVTSLAPLWTNRYPPLQDYPDWLLQAQILRRFHDPELRFSEHYAILGPLGPSAGGVLLIYAVSFLVPIEIAGRLVLSFCALALPLAFLCFVRSVQNRPSAADFFCLFLGYNFFFFMGYLGYVLGLAGLFLLLSYLWHRRSLPWAFSSLLPLSVAAVLLFVMHPISWALLAFVLGTWLFLSPGPARRMNLVFLGLSFIPSSLLFARHFLSGHSPVVWFPYPSLTSKLVSYIEPFVIFPAWFPWPSPVPAFANPTFWFAIGAIVWATLKSAPPCYPLRRTEPVLVATSLGLLSFTLVSPAWAFGLLRPDERLVIPAALLACGAVAWPRPKVICDVLLALLFVGVLLLHSKAISHGSRHITSLVEDLSPFVTRESHPFFLPLPCPRAGTLPTPFLPAVDAASRAGFYWTIARGGNNRQIFETRLLRVRDGLPPWIVSIPAVPQDQIATAVEQFRREFLLEYRYVALIGCRAAVQEAIAALAPDFTPLPSAFRLPYITVVSRHE